jgi:hypothetical protein
MTLALELLGDDAAPVSPIWGLLNASLNGLTLVIVAIIAKRL